MPDKEIMKSFIFPAFLASFEEIQSAVYEEFEVDEDVIRNQRMNLEVCRFISNIFLVIFFVPQEVEEATSTYSSNENSAVGKKISMVSSKIREIYSKFGGDLEFPGNK